MTGLFSLQSSAIEDRNTSKQAGNAYIQVLWLLNVSFRYDLLCIEGIARALRVFLNKEKAPEYRLVYPRGGEKDLIEVTVAPEVSQLQQHLVCTL